MTSQELLKNPIDSQETEENRTFFLAPVTSKQLSHEIEMKVFKTIRENSSTGEDISIVELFDADTSIRFRMSSADYLQLDLLHQLKVNDSVRVSFRLFQTNGNLEPSNTFNYMITDIRMVVSKIDEWFQYVNKFDLNGIKRMLSEGFPVDTESSSGYWAMYSMVRNNQCDPSTILKRINIIDCLMENGTDIKKEWHDGLHHPDSTIFYNMCFFGGIHPINVHLIEKHNLLGMLTKKQLREMHKIASHYKYDYMLEQLAKFI